MDKRRKTPDARRRPSRTTRGVPTAREQNRRQDEPASPAIGESRHETPSGLLLRSRSAAPGVEPGPATPPRWPIVGIGASAEALDSVVSFLVSATNHHRVSSRRSQAFASRRSSLRTGNATEPPLAFAGNGSSSVATPCADGPGPGAAFVVVVRGLSSPDALALVEDLRRATGAPVAPAKEAGTFEPGRIYVVGADRWPSISRGALQVEDAPSKRLDPSRAATDQTPADATDLASGHPVQAAPAIAPHEEGPLAEGPIDHFLESLADEYGERAVAVILAGAGNDGAVGVRAIRDLGGLALAQHPDSASPPEMPASAMDSGMIEDALPLHALAVRVREYAARLDGGRTGPGLRSLLRDSTGREFAARGHQTASAKRRRGNDERHREPQLLRDPECWLALRDRVLAPLLRARSASIPFRAWVVSGSTSEDAYSLALLVTEAARGLDPAPEVRILASVTEVDALAAARRGVFSAAAIKRLPTHLRRYFFAERGEYRVVDRVRDSLVFAHHDLFNHAPFTRLDLLVCRDLASTFEGPVRAHLIETLHRALNPGGALLLGARETIAAPGPHRWFEAIDRRHRIFRSVVQSERSRSALSGLGADTALARSNGATASEAETQRLVEDFRRLSSGRILRQSMVDQFAPAAVLTDESLRVLDVHGEALGFLSTPDGESTIDLLALVERRLVDPMRCAARQALDERRATVAVVESLDGEESVSLTFVPVEGPGATRLLSVTITPLAPLTRPVAHGQPAIVLQSDLLDPNRADRSRAWIATLGAGSNEAAENRNLRSLVDELYVSREELESSREELRTMNEEIEQANARLLIANAELEAQLFQLKALSDDVLHLLEGTELAAVFLDPEGCIRRFTPAVREVIRLLPADVGRPLSDFARAFEDPTLDADIARALEHSLPAESVGRGKADRWFLRRVTPFWTARGEPDGAVVTFTDISARQRAEESLRRSNAELEERVRQRTAVAVLLQDVAVIANSTASMESAFVATLERLCRDEAWLGGHVYLVRDGMAQDSVWHRTRGGDRTLETLFGGSSFASGEGLIGQVIEDGEPRFASVPDSDPRFARGWGQGREVRSITVFPILAGERVVGAFELFSRGAEAPSAGLLDLMRNVGTQIGRVIEREEARERIFDLAVEEQRSLGEELHDTLSQQVHGLSMLAQSMVRGLAAAGIDEARVRALVDGLVATHEQIRVLSNGLVPVQVEAGGLPAALEEMARGWQQMHGAECVFEHEGNGDGDDDRVATALYRIAREAARNAVLHGGALRVVIRLIDSDGSLTLEVQDDGRGMAMVPVDGPGMGLQIMRHRAEHVGGTLEIESSPGRGTMVRCRIVSTRGLGVERQS